MDIITAETGEPALAVELSNNFSFVQRNDLPKEVQAKLHPSVQGLLVKKKLAAEYALLKKGESSQQRSH